MLRKQVTSRFSRVVVDETTQHIPPRDGPSGCCSQYLNNRAESSWGQCGVPMRVEDARPGTFYEDLAGRNG